MGVDTTRYKVTAFVIGSFFAGLAGGLFAHYAAYLNPGTFTFMKSIEIVVMVVLGGLGAITGAIVGAIILTLLPEVLRASRPVPHGDLLADADRADAHAAAGTAGHAARSTAKRPRARRERRTA